MTRASRRAQGDCFSAVSLHLASRLELLLRRGGLFGRRGAVSPTSGGAVSPTSGGSAPEGCEWALSEKGLSEALPDFPDLPEPSRFGPLPIPRLLPRSGEQQVNLPAGHNREAQISRSETPIADGGQATAVVAGLGAGLLMGAAVLVGFHVYSRASAVPSHWKRRRGS